MQEDKKKRTMPDLEKLRRKNFFVLEALAYAAIVMVFVLLGLTLQRVVLLEHQEDQTTDLIRTQAEIAERVQEAINSKQLFARGLAGAISLRPDISESDFAKFCSKIKTEDPAVVNMALVQDMTVTRVYPEEDNAKLLGRSLKGMPQQAAMLAEIERTGKAALEGPVPLLQGQQGFILREPVFLNSDDGLGDKYHGVASVVFLADRFINEIRLSDFAGRYAVALRARSILGDVAMVYGDAQVFDLASETQELAFPSATWTLAVVPIAAPIKPLEMFGVIWGWIAVAMLSALTVASYLHRLRRENSYNIARLSAAISALPAGFVLFDRNDRLELCNESYKKIYGRAADTIVKGATMETILRATLKHGYFPDSIGREEEWMQLHLSRGDVKGEQFTVELENGRWLQIVERETPDGGRVAVLNDVTEPLMSRKRAKIAEQLLRDAIDALPVGFWLFDKDDRLVMFNTVAGVKLPKQLRDLSLGRELSELTQRRMEISDEIRLDGVQISDSAQAVEALRTETSDLEVRYEGNLWFKYYTRRTSEGGLVMFRVDITDLRHHQQRLEASNAELRAALTERDAAESRFRNVADISSEWFWEQDENMRLTYFSEGFARIMGRDPADFIGRLSPDLMLPDSSDPHSRKGTSLHAKMQAHEPFSNVIYNYKFHDDKESWIRTNGKPVFDKDGTFRGYIGTAEDVTLFYAALREAEQADEAKTQFLNVISHELRTPLTSVLGFNSFVANAVKLPSYAALRQALVAGETTEITRCFEAFLADITGFANRIRSAGVQLQSLIDDMLDLARIEANTMRLDLTRVDSQRVVTSVVEQMQALAAEKALELRMNVSDLPVLADEIRFRQILTNLLGNAVKFTDQGSITIENERQGDLVVFRVQDTGSGIAPDRLPIIFDRFAQAETGTGTTRKNPGVGLGLAICKDLVRLQNGWIKAESTLGEGATLTFALPVAPDA